MRVHRPANAEQGFVGLAAGGISVAVFTKRTAKTTTKTV